MDVVGESESQEAGSETFPPAHSPLDSIQGELHPQKTTLRYRLGLIVVAFAMILLPLTYFGFVGLVGYGVYYFATHYYSILGWEGLGYRLAIIKLIFYFGPLVIGSTLTFFLIKPIFNRRSRENQHYSLNFADAPQLFALIGWICRSLNAPIPSRIDVDCDVNASAHFRDGWRSLFGNDIVLTLGLPLVSGMTVDQLAGVIAHEYGHFSQGTAMRARYIIGSINLWFFRVVYDRDEWDDSLEEASKSEDQSLALMGLLYLTGLGVWMGRSVLKLLMIIGHGISSFMSRQMEYDADLYSLKMSGTRTFISTSQRLVQLDLGVAIAQKQLRNKWKKEGKLFDRLPEFVVSCANEVPAEAQNQLFDQRLKKKMRLFDSHPSSVERIKRATKANEPGIFHNSDPATSLFANFPELSRKVTAGQYEALKGSPFPANHLVSTEEVMREYDYSQDQQRIKNYFLGVATSLRPIAMAESKTLIFRSSEDLILDIKKARQQMQDMLPTAQDAYSTLKLADEEILLARQALSLMQAGYTYNPADFGAENLDAEEALATTRRKFDAAAAQLQSFEAAAKTRLLAALQLLRLPLVVPSIPDAVKLQDHAKHMTWTLARLSEIFDPLLEVRQECAALAMLLQYRQTHGTGENSSSEIEFLQTGIQELLNTIQQRIGTIQNPFQNASQNVFVSDYARNKEYHPDPLQQVLREGNSHVEKLIALYYRLLANLVTIAETVEYHTVDNHA